MWYSSLTSIHHGLPGLLLPVLDLDHEVVQLCLHPPHVALQPPLLDGEEAVGVGHLADGLPHLGELTLDVAAGPLGRVQKNAGLVQFARENVAWKGEKEGRLILLYISLSNFLGPPCII